MWVEAPPAPPRPREGGASRYGVDGQEWVIPVALWGVVGIAVPFTIQYVLLGANRAAVGILLGQGVALGGLLATRRGLHHLGAQAVIFSLWLAVYSSRFDVGGFWDPGTAWLVLIPVLSGLMLSLRSAVVWTLVAGFSVASLAGLDVLGLTPRNLIDESYRTAHALFDFLGIFASLLLSVVNYVRVQARFAHRTLETQQALQEEVAVRRAAEESAVRSSRAKDDFLAMMSHEIRTPMNGVLGMTGLLLEGELPSREREYAQTVLVSAEALLEIINDVLDFSKIEAGKLELEAEEFEVRRLFEEACDLVAFRAHEKGLELALEVTPEVPSHAVGDPSRIRQVLLNLLGNAVKFTESGRVTLTVDLDSESRFQCAIEDTGIGIEAEVLPRLFAPFTQGDSSITRQYGGTGLGLSIARQMAQAMGGDIAVRSRAGVGSTFVFTAALEARPRPPRSLTAGLLTNRRFLVVDDNPVVLRMVRRQLEDLGAEVVAHADGPSALQHLESPGEVPVDAALIDRAMPEMDGLQLSEAIGRAHPSLPRLLFVSWASTPEIAVLERAGVRALLRKPIRARPLRKAVCGLFDGAPMPQAAPSAPSAKPRVGRVLVVDDNAVNRKVARRMLERLGFDVDEAEDGALAVERVGGASYCAVLMDCQMPVMDGYEATRRIQAKFGDRAPRIIALTAGARASDRTRALASGMDEFIAKPVTLQALEQALVIGDGATADLAAAVAAGETPRTSLA